MTDVVNNRRRCSMMLLWLKAQVKAGRRAVPTSAGTKPALVRVREHMRVSRGEPGAKDGRLSTLMACLPRTMASLTLAGLFFFFDFTGLKDTGAMGTRDGAGVGSKEGPVGWGTQPRRCEASLRAKAGGCRHVWHWWRAVVLQVYKAVRVGWEVGRSEGWLVGSLRGRWEGREAGEGASVGRRVGGFVAEIGE